jgi:hypothetical protein
MNRAILTAALLVPLAASAQEPPRTVRPLSHPRLPPDATLVTTAAKLQPAAPTVGDKISVLATVENQAGPTSKAGLGFFVVCSAVTGGPTCPGKTFTATLPAIPYGTSHQVTVALSGSWPAGQYRLLAGTEIITAKGMLELTLQVKPARFPGVRRQQGEVREQKDLSAGAARHVRAGTTDLAFAVPKPNTLELVKGPREITFYRSSAKLRLLWTAPASATSAWRWQVSLKGFPASNGPSPAGLLAEGDATGESSPPGRAFWLDFLAFPPLGGKTTATRAVRPGTVPGGGAPATADQALAPASPAAASQTDLPSAGAYPDGKMDFHIRIVPLKGGEPSGMPSNTVIAHYLPGPNPGDPAADGIDPNAQQKAVAAFMKAAAVHQVDILDARLPVFEDPSRWGCIVVVRNPYYAELHPLGPYRKGKEYCPPKDPDKMEKSTGEKVVEGVEGFGKAWDGLAWAYDQAQGWVAGQFSELVPCEWLGDEAESSCEKIARQVAATAIKVGLAAAGVPPTIPDLEGMGDVAKGKAADAAADYTCDIVESEGGTCTPEMRAAMEKVYAKGLDQLRLALEKQAEEPGCGDVQTAKELGLQPLPCFGVFPGAEVKPAAGSVDQPAKVTFRVTRLKPDPDFLPACEVTARSWMKSFSTVLGKPYEWEPFKRAAGAALPPLAVGKSAVVTLELPRNLFALKGETPAATWWDLYRNADGWFHAGVTTVKSVTAPDGRSGPIPCSEGDSRTFKGTT